MGGRYLTAAICVNGHVRTDGIERNQGRYDRFCAQCGASVIAQCPNCKTPIRGDYHSDEVAVLAMYVTPAPAFCFQCGQPFPWTVEKLRAAKDLADEVEGLTSDDRTKLKDALDDISKVGPRNEVGAARIKRLLANATTATGKALWKIAIDVATEAAKKAMTGS
jgi:hypothetical protein